MVVFRGVVTFVAVAIAFCALLTESGRRLPDRIATHFDLLGSADGWSSRDAYLRGVVETGLVIVPVVAGVTYFFRRHVGDAIGFASVGPSILGWNLIIIMWANALTPPKMPVAAIAMLIGGVVIILLVLVFTFIRPTMRAA